MNPSQRFLFLTVILLVPVSAALSQVGQSIGKIGAREVFQVSRDVITQYPELEPAVRSALRQAAPAMDEAIKLRELERPKTDKEWSTLFREYGRYSEVLGGLLKSFRNHFAKRYTLVAQLLRDDRIGKERRRAKLQLEVEQSKLDAFLEVQGQLLSGANQEALLDGRQPKIQWPAKMPPADRATIEELVRDALAIPAPGEKESAVLERKAKLSRFFRDELEDMAETFESVLRARELDERSVSIELFALEEKVAREWDALLIMQIDMASMASKQAGAVEGLMMQRRTRALIEEYRMGALR